MCSGVFVMTSKVVVARQFAGGLNFAGEAERSSLRAAW